MVLAVFAVLPLQATVIVLDFDTPQTGSNIIDAPLLTALGTITVSNAELISPTPDADMAAAGSAGNVIDWLASPPFPSLNFVYGGVIDIHVIAFAGPAFLSQELVSFYQPSIESGQPAGPLLLMADGIRSVGWFTSEGGAGPFPKEPLSLDNIMISDTPVPEPATLVMGTIGLLLIVAARAIAPRSRGRATLKGLARTGKLKRSIAISPAPIDGKPVRTSLRGPCEKFGFPP
jgi:hypothetical protein